jgi:hypothetical protein
MIGFPLFFSPCPLWFKKHFHHPLAPAPSGTRGTRGDDSPLTQDSTSSPAHLTNKHLQSDLHAPPLEFIFRPGGVIIEEVFLATDGKGRHERQTNRVFLSGKLPGNMRPTTYAKHERIKQNIFAHKEIPRLPIPSVANPLLSQHVALDHSLGIFKVHQQPNLEPGRLQIIQHLRLMLSPQLARGL